MRRCRRARHCDRLAAVVLAVPCLLSVAVAEESQGPATINLAKLDALIDEADREHWSFQPVRRPPVPEVEATAWVRNPIDHFVLARLEAKGWKPSPPAAPRSLLRRIYLDLIGLPPTPDEQQAFLAGPSPQAVDALVDQLLGRPGYGERWARHWLDLVRFAETNGYERDATKPHAWRFRDYVIRSLNDDKPFDRLILEQLAGDELDDATSETVIATGYYRLGPWDDEPADPQEDRFDQLDDMLNTTSLAFLGLTLACARCHDHKFEPLTQHDYYRMVAVFNTLSRPRSGRKELDRPAGSGAQLAAVAERDKKIAEQQQLIRTARERFLDSGQSGLPADVIAAFRADPAKRNAAQKMLADNNAAKFAAALDRETKGRIATAEAEIKRLRESTPDLLRGYFMEEKSPTVPTTHLLVRGKARSPGPEVLPGVPTVLARSQPVFPRGGEHTSRSRLGLARWIADPANPLTARVIVNRVWLHHFGVGLVRTPSDFGVMGQEPTHPELLDWLADWFVREGGWSLKDLHRLILASNTYRMSKRSNPQYAEANPTNELLWRVPYRRLEVEAIRDSVLAVSGQLSRRMYGPSMYPSVPRAALEGHSDPDKIWKPLDERETSRRTVYAFIKRSMVVPMLEVLDLCDTTRSSAQRNVTSVAPQALTLFNGEFVNRQARHFAARVVREAGHDAPRQIDLAYRLALCRPPTATERAAMLKFLEANSTVPPTKDGKPADVAEAKRLALEQVCRVIFNLNEFVYPD